jgi:hypothetical protein
MKIDRERLAWAAGFFEGEGCIATRSEGIGLQVTQADVECLARLAAIFGFGTVRSIRAGGSLGKKPLFIWATWNYEHVQAFVAAVWPWLSERRKIQARRALKAVQARAVPQTQCKRGHALDNAYVWKGHRACRQCHNERHRRKPLLEVV